MTFAQAQIIQQGQNYHVQHGTDAGLFVQFYMESLHDEEASAEQGRPIFVDKEFIKIIPVGDKNTVVCRPVKLDYDAGTPPDPERWPNQYQQFKNQQVQVNEGTPLEQWPILTKSQVMTFKAVNVHTVEQLVAVSDGNLANLGMGARELQDKAKAFLEKAANGSDVTKLLARISDLEKIIEGLKNQSSGFEQEKKRGRPAKSE